MAGTWDFSAPGAGHTQRAALARATLQWLNELWQAAQPPKSGVALACTGSLARRDCGPFSDLDLILLYDRRTALPVGLADAMWYPIWDSGIALDHSVRSIQQCRQVANEDLSVAQALLEVSPIAGDPEVVARVSRQLADDWRANARKRFGELTASIHQRHERHGDLAQSLEPDLKEARGGLRDMGVLRALTASWLADRPHGAVDRAYRDLLDLRDAQQVVTSRPHNRLRLADQDDVAALVGAPDADAVVSRAYRASREIAAALDATLRRAGQSHRARIRRPGPRRPELTPLGSGIYLHDGELVLGRGFRPDDSLLPLRTAACAATESVPISPSALERLASFPTPATPWEPAARELLLQTLSGPALQTVWNQLDLTGVIQAWLPEWDGIRDRPQRNPLHRHTVDRHSIETVLQAQALSAPTPRRDLLSLAALLHDIGKTPGTTDHPSEGAPLAEQAVARFGLPVDDCAAVRILVAEHLTLATLATKQDPADPATAAELARRLEGRRVLLGILALLTEADSRAAGPRTWTTARAALIKDLARRTDRFVR